MTNPVTVALQLSTPVANGIAQSQSLGAAGSLTLNGSFVSTISSGTIASLSPARRVAIQSTGNDSSINWILTGYDRYGNIESETFAGGVSVATYSKYDYTTVTSIVSTGATASTVVAGTNGVGSTPWFVREFLSIGTLGVAMEFALTNPATASFELTWDDPNAAQSAQLQPLQASVNPQSNVPPVVWPVAGLTTISSNTMLQVNIPFYAWRMTQFTGTTTSICQVVTTAPIMQGGPGGVF